MINKSINLYPAIHNYINCLVENEEPLGVAHEKAASELGSWIAETSQLGQAVKIIVICTGNSRRSMLGSVLGNAVAAYFKLPEVRFYSGGTAPSAFNNRTISALRAVGFVIEPDGTEAPRGEPDLPNSKHLVQWGTPRALDRELEIAYEINGLELTEFSKCYFDQSNPQENFAAVMVCTSADSGCPVVRGAALRVSAPFDDPKDFDDTPQESQAYADCRDEIARMMVMALKVARVRIEGTRSPQGLQQGQQ